MSLVKWGFIGLLVLPAAELATFVLVAALIGWLAAAMLFVATSVVGVMLLRHSGRDNFDRLRAAFAQEGFRQSIWKPRGPPLGGICWYFRFIIDTWRRPVPAAAAGSLARRAAPRPPQAVTGPSHHRSRAQRMAPASRPKAQPPAQITSRAQKSDKWRVLAPRRVTSLSGAGRCVSHAACGKCRR